MKWWDDIWLNESFATYMSVKANDATFPKWEIRTQYLLDTVDYALASDQFKSTSPIRVHVDNPAQATAAFESGIAYDKGCSVLNMIEDYIGPEVFRNALHAYLRAHAYGNAEGRDLWTAMEKEARRVHKNIPVVKVVSHWINTAGYPIVSVELGEGSFKLRQSRFYIDGEEKKSSGWPIPIRDVTDRGKDSRFLMSCAEQTLPRAGAEWLKLNHLQNGFYRVNYEDGLLDRLGEAIRDKELGPIDAWGIENDLFVFTRSGRMGAQTYLRFLQDYCFDGDYPLNTSVLGHINWIYGMLYSTRLAPMAEKPLVEYSRKVLDRLGTARRKDERNVDTMLRASALFSLGLTEDKKAVDLARRFFSESMSAGRVLDKNLTGAAYRTVLWNGGREELEELKARYMRAKVPEDKLRALASLGFLKSPKLMREVLDFALSKQVRYQDAIYVVGGAADFYPAAKELIWKWTSANWKTLLDHYPVGTHMMEGFVSRLSVQSDEAARREIGAFFSRKANARADITRVLSKTLARIDTNIRFMKKNGV